MPERSDGAPGPSVFLLDGTYLVFRSFFAIRELSAPDGTPTNAVFGLLSTARKILREHEPGAFAVAFDLEGPTHRDELFAEYKANRAEPPAALAPQFALARELCEALGWPVITADGFEADDVIATLVEQAAERELQVTVVTADKDLYQLVRPGVQVLNPMKDSRLLDEEGVEEVFGVAPDQVVDVLALMGDASDNVPGVPGVGEKTAKAAIRRYANLDRVLERARLFSELWQAKEDALARFDDGGEPAVEDVTRVSEAARALLRLEEEASTEGVGDDLRERLEGAVEAGRNAERAAWKGVKKALKELEKKTQPKTWLAMAEHAREARLARELVTIRRDAPVTLALGTMQPDRPELPRARELAERLGFRDLSEELARRSEGLGLDEPPAIADGLDITILRDFGALEEFLAGLGEGDALAVDTETDSLDARHARLVGISLARDGEGGAYIPVAHRSGAPDDWDVMRERLAEVFGDRRRPKIGQNLKFDAAVLRGAGMPLRGIGFDTLLAAQLLDPGRDVSHRLDDLAQRYLGQRTVHYGEVVGRGEDELTFDQVDVEHAARYAVEDAVVAWRLAVVLREELEQAGLSTVCEEIEVPLVEVLEDMEHAGIAIDLERLEEIRESLLEEENRLEKEIHELAGHPFNIASPIQLREVLFDELGLRPTGRRTQKTKAHSTGQQALEAISDQHPLPARVLHYREVTKLRSTYVEALPRLVDEADGRVHTQFHQLGAATGRLSSSDPNLQNIPIRTELGRSIRQAFVPAPGQLLLSADYSQMELRVLAHLSGDEALIEAFRGEVDIHRYTAALVGGVDLEDVDDTMRARAKAVNFGIIYGMSEFRLAREQNMSREEARSFIDAYFARYPLVKAYIEGVERSVQETGEVRTLFGRRRSFSELVRGEGQARLPVNVRDQLLRQAVNATVQGTAADIVKIAMVRLHRAIEERGLPLRLLLQVHDELVAEVERDAAGEAVGLVRDVMQGAVELAVPLLVEARTAGNWAEAH